MCLSSAIMILGGEYACRRQELQPIQFGLRNESSSISQSMELETQAEVKRDLERGLQEGADSTNPE